MAEHKQTQVLEALHALKAASKDIEANSDDSDCNSPSMKALFELETSSLSLLSGDPKLSSLLSRLKSLSAAGAASEISRVAGSIGSELQSWIDRRSIDRLISPNSSDDEKISLLVALESRLSQGFDRGFQHLLLRSGVFSAVESLLSDPNLSKPVRDRSAATILAFVRFNKAVFVGEVLMGPTVRSLVSIASPTALRVLNGLIALIRSPIVDELLAGAEIANIVTLLSDLNDIEIRVLAFDTVLEIGYYGRKEAIDKLIELGLIEKLVEIQRSKVGGLMIEEDDEDEDEDGVRVGGVRRREARERRRRPLESCVWRFAVQIEVGEGLRQRERREIKEEVLRRVRKAAVTAVEEAAVTAEVLWGATCW